MITVQRTFTYTVESKSQFDFKSQSISHMTIRLLEDSTRIQFEIGHKSVTIKFETVKNCKTQCQKRLSTKTVSSAVLYGPKC